MKATCLDPELTLKFVMDTQSREWKKFKRVYGDNAEQKFYTVWLVKSRKARYMF